MESYCAFVGAVARDVAATKTRFQKNYKANVSIHAIPFFGCPSNAVVATVGLNPSPTEFENERWPSEPLSPERHLERLVEYFVQPTRPSHKWFETWEESLGCLGRSYQRDAIHLDLSPRATIPFSSNDVNQRVFVEMVKHDLRWFFELLPMIKGLRGLLIAGSACKESKSGNVRSAYLYETLAAAAPTFGYHFGEMEILDRSGCHTRRYCLTDDRQKRLPVFFFGSSPSSRTPRALVERIKKHASLIRANGL